MTPTAEMRPRPSKAEFSSFSFSSLDLQIRRARTFFRFVRFFATMLTLARHPLLSRLIISATPSQAVATLAQTPCYQQDSVTLFGLSRQKNLLRLEIRRDRTEASSRGIDPPQSLRNRRTIAGDVSTLSSGSIASFLIQAGT